MFITHLPHEGVEVVDSVIFNQLVVIFEVYLEKVFKQLIFSDFPVNVGTVVVDKLGNIKIG